MIKKITTFLFIFLISTKLFGQNYSLVVNQCADSLAVKMIATGKKKVAVVDFINIDKSTSQLGVFLNDEISSELSNMTQGKFKVLERYKLEEILKEKGKIITWNGPALAKELGRLSIADVLIFGTITEMESDGYYRLSMSLLDTKDGDKLGSYKANITRTASLNLLAKTPTNGFESSSHTDDPIPPRGDCNKKDYTIKYENNNSSSDYYLFLAKKEVNSIKDSDVIESSKVMVSASSFWFQHGTLGGTYYLCSVKRYEEKVRYLQKITISGCNNFKITIDAIDRITIEEFNQK